MNKKTYFNINLFIFLSLLLVLFARADTEITSVPYTITASGNYYITQNLSASSGNTITVEASNVVLNLNGYKISNTGGYYTLYILTSGTEENPSNIIVKNGYVSSSGTAIELVGNDYYGSLSDINLTNLTVTAGASSYVVEALGLIHNTVILDNDFSGSTLRLSTLNGNYPEINISFNEFQDVSFDTLSGYSSVVYHNNLINVSSDSKLNNLNDELLNNYFYGNYWANSVGTGFSENCSDSDNNGICDSSYTIPSGQTDYKPLADIGLTNYETYQQSGNYTNVTEEEFYNYTPLQHQTDYCPFDGRNYIFCDGFEYTEPIDYLGWYYYYGEYNGTDFVNQEPIYPNVTSYTYTNVLNLPRYTDYKDSYGFPYNSKSILHAFGISFEPPYSKKVQECYKYPVGNTMFSPYCHAPQVNSVGYLYVSFDYFYNNSEYENYSGYVYAPELYFSIASDLMYDSYGNDSYISASSSFPYINMWIINGTMYLEDFDNEYIDANGSFNPEYIVLDDAVKSGDNIMIVIGLRTIYYWKGEYKKWGIYDVYVNNNRVVGGKKAGFDWTATSRGIPSYLVNPLDDVRSIVFTSNFGKQQYIDNVKIWYIPNRNIEGFVKDAITNTTVKNVHIDGVGIKKGYSYSHITNDNGFFNFRSFGSNVVYDAYKITLTFNGEDITNTSYAYLVDRAGNPISEKIYLKDGYLYPSGNDYLIYIYAYENKTTSPDDWFEDLARQYNLGTISKLGISVLALIIIGIALFGIHPAVGIIGEVGLIAFLTAIGWIPAWVVLLIFIVGVLAVVLIVFKRGV